MLSFNNKQLPKRFKKLHINAKLILSPNVSKKNINSGNIKGSSSTKSTTSSRVKKMNNNKVNN